MPPVSQRSIQIDPFFDGEGGGVQQMPTRQTAPPVTPPSQYGYQDATSVQLSNGMPMTSRMRQGPAGLQGTVIPRATLGGIPSGTRPHSTQDIIMHVDPHIDGQSSQVRLGDITPESVRQAAQQAAQVTPDPYDVATLRLRGAATMHGIAANSQHHAPQQPQQMQMAPTQTIAAPNLGRMGQPVQRHVRPLQAFSQSPPDVHEGRPLRAIDMGQTPTVERGPAPPAAPQIEVTFEIEHFGTHTAMYHDVIIEQGFMVLVYKTGYRGGGKYFPGANGSQNQPPLAVNITGTNEVYLVQVTGILYAVDGAEHCVLMIDQVGQLQ